MRFLIGLTVLLALLYGGYWVIGSTAAERGAARFADDLRADGWTVDYDDLGTRGFPSRFDTTVEGLRLDNGAGFGWQAPFFQVLALSYRPNRIIAVWPPEQQVTLPGQRLTVTSEGLRASATVAPTLALPLDAVTAEVETARVTSDAGWQAGLDNGLAAFRRAGPGPDSYDAFASADAIAMPAPLRALLDPTAARPATVENLHLDAQLTFARPLDLSARDGAPPLTGIHLRAARLVWGTLELSATATLTFDATGRAAGALTLTASDWRPLLDMALAADLIDPGAAPELERAATALAEGTRIVLPIDLADGLMRLGPLPLGPAPRLRWQGAQRQ